MFLILEHSYPAEGIGLHSVRRHFEVERGRKALSRRTPETAIPSEVAPNVSAFTADYSLPTAFRSAARASKRVESSVGSGDESAETSSGISVQPSTTASHPSSARARIASVK